MQTKESKVRTGGEVVDTIQIPIYETMDELQEHEEADRILACFNHGNAIRLQGNARAKFAVKPLTKIGRLELTFDMLQSGELEDVLDSETIESAKGDFMMIKKLAEENDEVKAAVDAKYKASLGTEND